MVVLGPTRQLRTALHVTETGGVSVKKECLDRIIPLGERHFGHAVTEFVGHYHRERNHQGQRNELIERVGPPCRFEGRIRRRLRLGGLLNYCERTAWRPRGQAWSSSADGRGPQERERTLCA